MVLDWWEATMVAFQNIWQGFLEFVPNLVGAVIVFIIGWLVASAIGKVVVRILEKIKFNQYLEKAGWKESLEKADIKIDAAGFIGAVFKWILVIVFLLIAAEILQLYKFADFLGRVLDYLPRIAIAILIFVVTVILADILEKIARAAVEKTKIGYSHIVGLIVKWSIWIFALAAILLQLEIIPEGMVYTLFSGFIGMIVIAGGLAFGLGGKEIAAELLRDIQRKIKGGA